MTDANVVHLNPIAHARAVKAGLWNPPNARKSTELDITSGSELKRRRAAAQQQREEIRRAEEDFRRQIAIDDLIREALADHQKTKEIAYQIYVEDITAPPKIRVIIDAVAEAFEVTRLDMLSHRRTADIVGPRQVAMYLAKMLTFKSLPEIGMQFGGRDHTTVLHAVRRVAARMEMKPKFAAKVLAIREKLSAQL